MVSFIIPIIIFIFALLILIFSFIALKTNAPRDNKYTKLTAVFSALITLVSILDINIPKPTIYPLNTPVTIYTDKAEVKIESNSFFDTYYSTDGSNPIYGTKYEDVFVVTAPTTVVAINKFFIWKSETDINTFQFENLSNSDKIVYSNNTDLASEIQPVQTPTFVPTAEPTKDNSAIISSIESSTAPTEKPTPTLAPAPTLTPTSTPVPTPTVAPIYVNEGQNPSEGTNLMNYVNQYRANAGLAALVWNPDLEQSAQSLAAMFATGGSVEVDISIEVIGRQCNGAKNAEKAVSDWINGNAYIPSESDRLLNPGFTQIGGALYYLPNGNEYGYHYFWAICLR